MARIRSIKIDFFHDEDLCDLPYEYRLMFIGLWLLADREGRLEDRPRYIKTQIFPHDEVDVELVLNTLSKPKRDGGLPFIHRYTTGTNGERGYIQIVNFLKHQRPHHTEKQSDLPPHGELTVKEPLGNGEGTVSSRTEGKGMEGKGKRSKDLPSRSQNHSDKSPKNTKPVEKGHLLHGLSDNDAIRNLGNLIDSKRKELNIR